MDKVKLDTLRKNVDILERYLINVDNSISLSAFGTETIYSEEINAIYELVEIINKEILGN